MEVKKDKKERNCDDVNSDLLLVWWRGMIRNMVILTWKTELAQD